MKTGNLSVFIRLYLLENPTKKNSLYNDTIPLCNNFKFTNNSPKFEHLAIRN